MRKLLKMAISLQYFRKEANDEVYFSHADKQSFLQVDTIFFDGFGLAWPKHSGKFAISLQYLKKEVCNILIFVMFIDLVMGIIFFIWVKVFRNGPFSFVEDSY